ncbi:MAG: fluoride efflux transporter CrcB [Caldilineaceae bacterium]|nr:fluoride efflux transporter CrcB [Caldilineaceae bacterium]
MSDILMVGLGGFMGAILRFLVTATVQRSVDTNWPVGTFVVNILGCFIIGYLSQIAETRQWLTLEMRLFMVTGFLGAFTTFSTFGNESVALLQRNESFAALAYVGLHLLVGFSAVWLGQLLAGR